jgi:hypothetical protein
MYATWLHDTICTTFHRTCATLVDPKTDEIDRAVRLLTPLADTLEGFAIGTAIGHVASGVRRWSGEAAGKAVLARLRRYIRSAAAAEPAALDASGLDAVAPTLAGEFAARMHHRLAHMPVAMFVAEAGAQASPVATHDDLVAPRLAAEIEAGWQHYRALIAGTRLATTSPMWSAWDKKVRGEREERLRDYVMRVA